MIEHNADTTDIKIWTTSGISFGLSLAVALCASAVFLFYIVYPGSEVESSLAYISQSLEQPYATLQQLNEQMNSSEFLADFAVFVVWMFIGLLFYELVMLIVSVVKGSILEAEMIAGAKEPQRLMIVRDFFLGLGVRMLGIIGIIAIVRFVLFVLPHAMVFVHMVGVQQNVFLSFGAVVFTGAVAFGVMHLMAMAIRCVVLRSRTFF